MAINPTSPITGSAQTGLTSPTYTLTPDVAPSQDGKQWAVTALGGTQIGVSAHSMAAPFTLTVTRVKNVRSVPQVNASTGLITSTSYPLNVSKSLIRKSMVPLTGQAPGVGSVSIEVRTVAGADTADPSSIRAMLSLAIGYLQQQSAALGDAVVSNIF